MSQLLLDEQIDWEQVPLALLRRWITVEVLPPFAFAQPQLIHEYARPGERLGESPHPGPQAGHVGWIAGPGEHPRGSSSSLAVGVADAGPHKVEHWLAHLANSRRTFLRLLDKARSFDERKAQLLIADRNYAALDQMVLEHLMGR